MSAASCGLKLRCIVRQHVKFKVDSLVTSTVAVRAGASLLGIICRLVSDSTRRCLWSADVMTCVVPRTLSSYGDRTFAAAGPCLWKSLLVYLRNPDNIYGLFRRQLKGHFFQEAWTRRSVTSDMWCLRKKHLLTYIAFATFSSFTRRSKRSMSSTLHTAVYLYIHPPAQKLSEFVLLVNIYVSFVLAMLKWWVPEWPFSPGIAFIWCLLFLLFHAVDW